MTRTDDGRFRILDSDTHYRGAIFDVRVDDVAMPGGGHARRELVEHMRAVAVVALDDDGSIVMIEQYRHPMRRRLWEIPAGLMDIDGEAPLATAQRELVEEVGLRAETWSVLVDLASSPGFSTETLRVYLAQGLRHVPAPSRQDEEADLRIVRVPLDVAVAGVLDGKIVNATAVAGILAAARICDVDTALRAADDVWTDGPATVSENQVIEDAPPLVED